MKSRIRYNYFIVFLWISACNSNLVFSQKIPIREVDSIEKIIMAESPDSTRFLNIKAAFYLGLTYADLKSQEKYLLWMKLELKKNPWARGQVLYHHLNGIYLFYQSNYKESLKENLISLKLAEEMNDIKAMGRSYSNIALIYQLRADYVTALKYHFKGLAIEKKLKSKQGIADSYNNIGIVYENIEQLSKALWYQSRSVRMRIQINDKEGTQKNYSNIGNIYFSLNKMDSAFYYYNKSLEVALKLKDKSTIAVALANICNVYYARKEYRRAIDYSKRALKIFEETEHKRGVLAAIGNLGENYFQLGLLDSARYYTQLALDLAIAIDAREMEYTNARTLLKISEAEENYKEGFYLSKRIAELKDSILGEEKKADIARLDIEHEYELRDEKNKAAAILEERKQKIILYSVISGLVISLLFGFVVLRSLRTNKKKNKIIEEQKILVEIKQKEVLDSIHYAKRIQEAIMPSERNMDKSLKRLQNKPYNLKS